MYCKIHGAAITNFDCPHCKQDEIEKWKMKYNEAMNMARWLAGQIAIKVDSISDRSDWLRYAEEHGKNYKIR